jgi:hypothetical protein
MAQTKTICWAQCSHREFISLRPLNSSHPLLSHGDQWPFISFGMSTPSVLRSKYAVHQNTKCGRWNLGCTLKTEGRHECDARRGQDAALSKLCSDYAAGPTNAAFWKCLTYVRLNVGIAAFRMSRNVSRYVHDLDVLCRMEQRGILRTYSTGRLEGFCAEANWTILVCCIMPLQPVRRRAC